MESMTKKEIAEALENDEIREIEEYKLDARYRDMLDDVYGDAKIAGMTYSTSRALERLDPTAYRVGFSDWLDSTEDIIEGPNGEYYERR